MKLFNFIIIKLTICLIIGILIGSLFSISLNNALIFTCISFLLLSISFFILRKKTSNTYWFSIVGLIGMMSIGILNSSLHDDRQFKSHYSHFINTLETTNFSIYFKVINVLKSSNFHNKYVVNILSIDSKNVIGKALLNINKDSTQGVLNVDDIVFTKTQFSEVTPPLNPHQFNYKNYLKKQYIHHQLIVSNSELFKTTKRDRTIYGSAANLRRHIQSKLKHYSFNQDEYAIINALLLGQR